MKYRIRKVNGCLIGQDEFETNKGIQMHSVTVKWIDYIGERVVITLDMDDKYHIYENELFVYVEGVK